MFDDFKNALKQQGRRNSDLSKDFTVIFQKGCINSTKYAELNKVSIGMQL